MSISHICVDIIMYPSGIFIKIGFIAGLKFFTGVPGRTKFPVAHTSYIASIFFIFNTDVEYAVSIVLEFQLLMIVVFLSSSLSSPVASIENLL